MEALELAMQMEKEGEQFYRELAEQEKNIGFREIFSKLAEDEQKHYHLFQAYITMLL